MKPEDKDYFTLANSIIDAMEKGDYVLDIAQDSPAKDKTAFIVQSQGFAEEDLRMVKVAALLATLFRKQLSRAEKTQVEEDIEFAATRYKDGCAFYFKMPEGRKIDFAHVREQYAAVVQMYKPKPLSALPVPEAIFNMRLGGNCEWVGLGPIHPAKQTLFQNVIGDIARFHRIQHDECIVHSFTSYDGTACHAIEKNSYERLIRNADIINESGLYKGKLLDLDAKPA